MSVAEVSGVPSSGLLAYYELDEASGTISNTGSITGIDGTANGSPTYSTTAIVNNGIDFDGSDYFELGSSLTAWKFLHDGSDWTISFWMKLNSGGIDTGVQNSIMGTGQGGYTEGLDIIGIEEKPVSRSHINAGIYVLGPKVLETMDAGEHCDMPKLFSRLQEKQAGRTIVYPMHEPWLDVGLMDDYLSSDKKNAPDK